ncbi:unnamed protein product [Microthlaspi erraticum]|uniref:RNase H type-1 domain-containing protein n=1 Tax=Microthlaspi erraticum TaxID=1685480 RepID=A0A6D2HK56_9BRAS|nr:unnamed protein product [Microthlaspi erraticum]
MSCFKIPVSLCKRIQSALTRFWWDQTPGTQKMSWTSWTKMTKSKSSGGLGFCDIQSFDALLAKLSWELETTDHLFFCCDYAQKVWSLAPFGKTLDLSLIHFKASINVLKRLVCLPPSGISYGPLFPWIWICWTIWSARNYHIFEDRSFTPEDTNLKAIQDAREWQEAQVLEKKPHQARPRPTNHRSLHPNTVVCFTDGAWKQETAIAGAGWIFTKREGIKLDSGSLAEPFASSPLKAEAIAIRSALVQALEKNFLHLQVKSDAKDLIRALTSQEKIKEIYGLLFDIQSLAKLFTSISF